MGKSSVVECGQDSPPASCRMGRSAGVVVATACFLITCAVFIVTIQWERRSEIENRQRTENLYEMENGIDELKAKLQNFNSSIKDLYDTLYKAEKALFELMDDMYESRSSLTELEETVHKFNISLVEMKEIFEKYKYNLTKMKKQQGEMKEGLDKLQDKYKGSSNHEKDTEGVPVEGSVSQNPPSGSMTRDDLALLKKTIRVLRYSVIDTVGDSSIIIFRDIFDIFKECFRKNCTSNNRTGEMDSTGWEEALERYNDMGGNLKKLFSFPPRVLLYPSVEKILISKAKDEEYRSSIDELRRLFTILKVQLNFAKENIDEFQNKWDIMVECMNKYAAANLESETHEQRPTVGRNKFDFVKLNRTILKIASDLPDMKTGADVFYNYISALEVQMDIAGRAPDVGDPEKDEVLLQANVHVPEESLFGSQEPIESEYTYEQWLNSTLNKQSGSYVYEEESTGSSSELEVTWLEAEKICQDRNEQLFVVATAKQQEDIVSAIGETSMEGRSFWISKRSKTAKDSLAPLSSPSAILDEASDTWSHNDEDTELCPFLDVNSMGESICSDKKSFICEVGG